MAAVILAACSSSSSDPSSPPSDGVAEGSGPTTPSSVTVPAFSGDCTTSMSSDLQVTPFDWSAQKLFALNCSSDGQGCILIKNEGDVPVMVNILFPIDRLNDPIKIDDSDTRPKDDDLSVTVDIGDTLYTNGNGATNDELQGTLVVHSFDPATGKASLEFQGATLIGMQVNVESNFRCAMKGTLTVDGFRTTPVGTRCQTDHECGGSYSGMVCGNQSFVCEAGCHTNDDCPSGALCDTSAAKCGVANASTDTRGDGGADGEDMLPKH